MTATERFKKLLADALERVCVLEEQVEKLTAQNHELNVRIDDMREQIKEA